MVHPTDPHLGVAQADGDAAPQDGGEHHIGIARHMMFALDHVDLLAGAGRSALMHHVRVPNTASIFSFRVWVVKGLTR